MDNDFQEFYDNTFKGGWRFFFYKNVGRSNIEDLVQEAYLRFFQSYLHKLSDLNESRKILNGICLNVYREWVKVQVQKGTVWEYVEELDWEEEKASFEEYSNPDFDNEMERRKILLREALNQLSGQVRQVLELRYLEGLTRHQTAEKLSVSEDQVHTYQKRGIRYLSDILNCQQSITDQSAKKTKPSVLVDASQALI